MTETRDPALVEAIKDRRWRELDTLDERLRALCELAEKLSGTPSRMTKADWAPLRALGFDDEACLEVAHIVGIFSYLTSLADGFGLALDSATRQAGATGEPLKHPAPR